MPKAIAHFTQCPNCGSERQLAVECAAETKEKQPGLPAVAAMMVPIIKTLTAEVVTVILDVCVECGTVYCKDVLRQEAQLKVAPGRAFPGNGLVGGVN